MKKYFQDFFSRFRKSAPDPLAPRTSAQSQLDDLKDQHPESRERKAFDEKTFEREKYVLEHPFGTSSHGGDNPFREEDLKNSH